MALREQLPPFTLPKRMDTTPLGAPADTFVEQIQIKKIPLSTQGKSSLNLSAFTSSVQIAPVKTPSKIPFAYHSGAYQYLFSKHIQRETPSTQLLHPRHFYLHTTFTSKSIFSEVQSISSFDLAEDDLHHLANEIIQGKQVRTGNPPAPSIRFDSRYDSLEFRGPLPHSTYQYLSAQQLKVKTLAPILKDWLSKALSETPILLVSMSETPSPDEIRGAIQHILNEFNDFYIKPAQGSSKGFDVYRVHIEEHLTGFQLTVGTTYNSFEESLFFERIDRDIISIKDDQKYVFERLTKEQLINVVTQIARLVQFPIIEETIPISTLQGKKVEFRVALIADQDSEEIEARSYSKISSDWTAGNVSIQGTVASTQETIELLIAEHVQLPPLSLAENILENLFQAAREFRVNYLDILNIKTNGLPEIYLPYELRDGAPIFVVDIGLSLLPDGKYELYLIEASFDGRLSYLELEDRDFANKFYRYVDTFKARYSSISTP